MSVNGRHIIIIYWLSSNNIWLLRADNICVDLYVWKTGRIGHLIAVYGGKY